MSVQAQNLGGRLPLLDPRDLSAAQREVYDRLNSTFVRWSDRIHFQSKTEDGKLIGPFNPILYSPGISFPFLDLHDAEEKQTSINERVRQVVILAVGAVWQCEYELYAHAAAAKMAGISEDAVRLLIIGGLPDDLSAQEKVAQRFARQLVAEHRVDAATYGAAEEAFGKQGLVDIAYLIGIYQLVCGLLSAFEIPVPNSQPSLDVSLSARISDRHPRQAELTTVATFPPKFFLENLAMRADHSLLVTVLNRGELWYVPPIDAPRPVEPVPLFNFPKNGGGQNAHGVVEVEPDVFYLGSSNFYTSGEGYLFRLDLRGWKPGSNAVAELVMQFPKAARGLNGMCLIAPRVLLVADSFAGLIWRVDLDAEGGRPRVREWLTDVSMGYFPGALKPEQPGVNGVRFAAKTNALYYTATAKKLLMRVQVDPQTHEAAGKPELIVAGRMGDDFLIDEDAQVLYLATHRQNTIDRVSMEPARNSGFTQSIAGDPFTENLIGPTSGTWGRGAGEYGRVAYFLTDGGTASPPRDGIFRAAKVLRVRF